MKTRQKSIKVLEIYINDFDKLVSYVEKNLDFLKKYFLSIYGEVDDRVEEYLKSYGLIFQKKEFFKNNEDIFKKNSGVSLNKILKKNKDVNRLIYNRPIRSGEEIDVQKDVTIFGRVNSGSRIFCSGNMEIFGQIHGTVICSGEFLILKNIKTGVVMFHDRLLDKKQFDDSIKKVTIKNGNLDIEEL
jgi:septum site-determining protein MinC